MQINVPVSLQRESGKISSILLELYEPLIVADNPNTKFAKPLKSIKIPISLGKEGLFSSAEVHDSVYANFKSLKFVVTYKEGTTDTIVFEDKNTFNQQAAEEKVQNIETSLPTQNMAIEPELLPTQEMAQAITLDFEDALTLEEKMIEARLTLLRSPEVLAKRREFAELSKRLAQLNTELQPVWLGKVQKASN